MQALRVYLVNNTSPGMAQCCEMPLAATCSLFNVPKPTPSTHATGKTRREVINGIVTNDILSLHTSDTTVV